MMPLSQAISILCQMGLHQFRFPTYGFLGVPFLAKGCRLDFNNGLRGDSNSGPILAPGVYLSPTRIMAPPYAISILCQMGLHLFRSPTYGFLMGAILAKGCRPDFNNGLRGDLNSGAILAPGVYLGLTLIMAPPQAIPTLNSKHELTQKLALDKHNC